MTKYFHVLAFLSLCCLAVSIIPEGRKIILDCGTGFVKAGYAGDDLPSVVVPNVVGRGGDKVYVGQEALDRAMVYQANLTRPMENCEVIKRADMKIVLEHVFKQLNETPSGKKVVLTQPSLDV
ncbi:uncharacterized protein LOC142348096 [Convolutriloba macropyga]|uniref:uncharacterized protein LOC142348096 n=1 Tax=Convolutriloba macropyga TaxID=536237 RepID=UPI003F51BA76